MGARKVVLSFGTIGGSMEAWIKIQTELHILLIASKEHIPMENPECGSGKNRQVQRASG
jgi:hypothetical protein